MRCGVVEGRTSRLGSLLNLGGLDGSLGSELSGGLLSDGDNGRGGRDLSLDHSGDGGLGLSEGSVGVSGGDSECRESGGLERSKASEEVLEM